MTMLMSQFWGLLRINPQVSPTPRLSIAEIARHFLAFFPVIGKMQFCRGVDLEKQLQLIAASEIHLSFILAFTQRRNKNMQKRK